MEIKGFDWDSGNWPKCGKHGVSRDEIERLFTEGKAVYSPDLDHTTLEEDRYIVVGRVDGKSLFVAFTLRGSLIRPVSARYMHKREARHYENSTTDEN
ncbi:MAG: BrnT family toxin [Oxalobacter sp.]|nr:BrnT family toxin [Oxalobacter sp.]